jgi:hypothetical protein
MPFNWNEHIRETAAHLLWMASLPGAREHAVLRRDQLLASDLYFPALRDELNRQQQEAKAKTS